MFCFPTLTKYTLIVTRRANSNLEFSRLLRILHWKGVTWGEPVPDPQQTLLISQPPALSCFSRGFICMSVNTLSGLYRQCHTHSPTAAIWLPLRSRGIYIRDMTFPQKNRPKGKVHADPGNTLGTMWTGNSEVEAYTRRDLGRYTVHLVDSSLCAEEYNWRRARAGFSKLWGQGLDQGLMLYNGPTFKKVSVLRYK